MKAIIYNSLGQIIRQVDAPEDFLDIQVQDGEFILKNIEVNDSMQYVNTITLELINFPPIPNNYSVFNWQTKEWENDLSILKAEIDLNRFQLLQVSDWTDTVSAQTRLTNYAEWQDYRQALRNIPSQSGYPENVIWPEQPK